jgi:hypothetical protein
MDGFDQGSTTGGGQDRTHHQLDGTDLEAGVFAVFAIVLSVCFGPVAGLLSACF